MNMPFCQKASTIYEFHFHMYINMNMNINIEFEKQTLTHAPVNSKHHDRTHLGCLELYQNGSSPEDCVRMEYAGHSL